MSENPSDDGKPGPWGQWWTLYVVPTASSVETFLWRVAWFVIVLKLFSII